MICKIKNRRNICGSIRQYIHPPKNNGDQIWEYISNIYSNVWFLFSYLSDISRSICNIFMFLSNHYPRDIIINLPIITIP